MSKMYRSKYDTLEELQDMTQKMGNKIRVVSVETLYEPNKYGVMFVVYYQITEELECKHTSIDNKNICLKCGQDTTTY